MLIRAIGCVCLYMTLIHAPAAAQGRWLDSLDAATLPDTTRIDLMTDQAWTLARRWPDSALSLAREAARRAEAQAPYPKGSINANMLIGILHKDRGYYELSVEHYLIALRQAERSGDSLRVSGCLNNLGAVYQEQGKLPSALAHFQRSLAIEEAHGQDMGQRSIRLYNIGESYQKMDSLDRAYAFYYNSLLIEQELGNSEGIMYARLGIGQVDTRIGNLAKAEGELKQALELATSFPNLPAICEAHIALGRLHTQQARFRDAATALDSALTLAKRQDYQSLQMQALWAQYELLRSQARHAEANSTLEAYYALKEQVNSATVNTRIGELRMRHELEKKDQEIATFKQKEALRATEEKYNRKLRDYLAFTVAFSIVLIVWNTWRTRRKGGPHG